MFQRPQVGPYVIGAINTHTGSYDGSYYFMAASSTVAALLVALFPTRWSHVPALKHGDRLQGPAAAGGEAAGAAAWEAAAAAAAAEAGAAGEREAARQRLRRRRRTLTESFLRAMAEGGNGECQLACPESVRCVCKWRSVFLLERHSFPFMLKSQSGVWAYGVLLRRLAGCGCHCCRWPPIPKRKVDGAHAALNFFHAHRSRLLPHLEAEDARLLAPHAATFSLGSVPAGKGTLGALGADGDDMARSLTV